MKKYLTNSTVKMLAFTIMALIAEVKPSFCQEPAIDNDLITYSMAVSSNQQVMIRVPLDIRPGDVITGSVVEDKKSNTGGVNRASSTLEGVVIEIDGKQTKLSNRIISFIVPAGLASLPFLLKNAAGQVIDRGVMPIGLYNYFDTRWQEPVGGLGIKFSPEAIGQPGQALKVKGSFDGNAPNTNISFGGQPCEIIAESPRMSYARVPENAKAGISNLSIEENNAQEVHTINVVTLELNASKTNLRRGEKANVYVVVSGLDGIKQPNSILKLKLENQSPHTISFVKESNNVITKDINTESIKQGKYKFSGKIIALTAGGFTIFAHLTDPNEEVDCLKIYQDRMAVIKAGRTQGITDCNKPGGSGNAGCVALVNSSSDLLETDALKAYLKCVEDNK